MKYKDAAGTVPSSCMCSAHGSHSFWCFVGFLGNTFQVWSVSCTWEVLGSWEGGNRPDVEKEALCFSLNVFPFSPLVIPFQPLAIYLFSASTFLGLCELAGAPFLPLRGVLDVRHPRY